MHVSSKYADINLDGEDPSHDNHIVLYSMNFYDTCKGLVVDRNVQFYQRASNTAFLIVEIENLQVPPRIDASQVRCMCSIIRG